MNYQKLTKSQLIDVINTQDKCINDLDQKLSEQTLQYKWEHLVNEGRLLVADLNKAAKYFYEHGVRMRSVFRSLNKPLLKPN